MLHVTHMSFLFLSMSANSLVSFISKFDWQSPPQSVPHVTFFSTQCYSIYCVVPVVMSNRKTDSYVSTYFTFFSSFLLFFFAFNRNYRPISLRLCSANSSIDPFERFCEDYCQISENWIFFLVLNRIRRSLMEGDQIRIECSLDEWFS